MKKYYLMAIKKGNLVAKNNLDNYNKYENNRLIQEENNRLIEEQNRLLSEMRDIQEKNLEIQRENIWQEELRRERERIDNWYKNY
jgi:hypothetical protein